MLLFVGIAGLFGSYIHVIRSLYWYVGNRKLVKSWLAKYYLLPIVGFILSMIFYGVIRGGFFGSGTSFKNTNPYSFLAIGALVGMFTENAVLKLKEVAEMVLFKPKPGKDSVPTDNAR